MDACGSPLVARIPPACAQMELDKVLFQPPIVVRGTGVMVPLLVFYPRRGRSGVRGHCCRAGRQSSRLRES